MFALSRDLASHISVLPAVADATLTAGSGSDNVDVNGITIDQLLTGRQKAECLTFVVQGTAVLAAAETLSLPVRVQDSADGSTWADVTDPRTAAVFSNTVVSTAGAGTIPVVNTLSVSTEYLRRYVRCVPKPNLSAGGTDTARLQGVVILSGLAKV